MNPVFKHLTVRLWLTALMGGALCLVVLPGWQRFFGLHWLVVPAMVVLLLCFGIIGWVLNRLGLTFVGRHIKEALAWERAGMMKEAESALQCAVAIFDGFWLSPLLRRQRTAGMTAIVARFYLGQTAYNSHARTLVAAYLRQHPEDDSVAQGWLEQLLNREHHSAEEYEAAARIGETLCEHGRIQQLLMQFHLANGRSDFNAMQTYQQVWQRQQPLPLELVRDLTRLLLNEGVLTHWALQVFLSAHRSGDTEALDGIAAAVRWLRPTVENHQDLITAQEVVEALGPDWMGRVPGRFKPTEHAAPTPTRARAGQGINKAAARTLKMTHGLLASSRTWVLAAACRSTALGRRAWSAAFSRPAVAVGGGIALLVVVLIVTGWQLKGEGPAPPPPPPPLAEPVKPVIEPFTIQVAAYISSEEARRLVDRLKQNGLDAFSTEAVSADRAWYQVKVAHFETKEQARRYGQELKTKGLIDDFYVANYQKPPSP
jgi:hypothetical protein